MKILFIFLIACGAALGADLLLGKWKEDENKRQNLSKFLKARGVNGFIAFFASSAKFQLKMNVQKKGNSYLIFGTRGPYDEKFKNVIVPNNSTRTIVDLGKEVGGKRQATAEFQGNTLVTYLHRLDNDKVDVIFTQSLTRNANVMFYKIKDVRTGVTMVQHMNRVNRF